MSFIIISKNYFLYPYLGEKLLALDSCFSINFKLLYNFQGKHPQVDFIIGATVTHSVPPIMAGLESPPHGKCTIYRC